MRKKASDTPDQASIPMEVEVDPVSAEPVSDPGEETQEEAEPEEPVSEIDRVDLPVEVLTTPGWNPNEMSPEELELLKENIREAGFVDPLTVVPLEDGKYAVIGGAHRLKAIQELGRTSVVCDVVRGEQWRSEDFQKFQNVRLNVIHGKLNPEKFLGLYNEMAAKYGKDKVTRLLGFTSDAGVRKIVKNVAKELRGSLPPEMAKQFEERAKEARTVGDLERIIQNLFQEHGDSVKFNFMVFAWGGKEHIYVSMSKKVHTAMKKIMAKSRLASLDINDIIGDALEKLAESLEQKTV